MRHQKETTHRPSVPKFVRVVGALWLGVVAAILLGALLAPRLGHIADVFLHYTVHRDWRHLSLHTEAPFFNLSTPTHAVKSYYSALYRSDARRMERLTHGTLHQQMRRRMAQREVAAGTIYRSYLHTEHRDAAQVVVIEKFHLFWKRGLRFSLQRIATDWRITHIALVR